MLFGCCARLNSLVWIPALCAVLLGALLLPASAMAMGKPTPVPTPTPSTPSVTPTPTPTGSCSEIYGAGFFNVCYFAGIDPTTGAFLGAETEPSPGSPAPDDAFGIRRDWGSGVIFAGRTSNISAIWRGRVDFSGGDYLFTFLSGGGMRVYLDDNPSQPVLLLDEWDNMFVSRLDDGKFVVPMADLSSGAHDIRIEWAKNTPVGVTRVEFLWGKRPAAGVPVVSDVKINVYILKRLETCIVGDKWERKTPRLNQFSVRKDSGATANTMSP